MTSCRQQSYAKEGDYAGTFAKMITITQECFDRGVSEDYLDTEDGSLIHYRKINSTEAMIVVLLAAVTGFCVYFGIWKSYRRENCVQYGYADLKRVNRDRRDVPIRPPCVDAQDPEGRRNHGGGGSGGGGGGWRRKPRSHIRQRKQPRRRKYDSKSPAHCAEYGTIFPVKNKCISGKNIETEGLREKRKQSIM